MHIRLGLTGGGPAESCGKPPIGSRGRPPTCNTPRTARKEPDRPEAPPAKNPTREGYSGASEWDWWGSWGNPGRGRVQICHKGAPGRDRSRRKPRNINDSSCAPRLDPGLCGRFRHGPGPDRVRLVPRDPRTPSVSGSASRRPSRLSRASLVPRTQIAEDLLCGFGELGLGGEAVAVDVDGDLLKWSEFADESLDAHPGGLLQVAGDGQGGHHDGQVGLDRVAGAVEDRAGSQVVLGSCGTTAPRATARGRRRSPRRPP